MNVQNSRAIAQKLLSEAEEKFGAERAGELRDAIAQMANELHALQSYQVSADDEP